MTGIEQQADAALAQRHFGTTEPVDALAAEIEDVIGIGNADSEVLGETEVHFQFGVVIVEAIAGAGEGDARQEHINFRALAQRAGPADDRVQFPIDAIVVLAGAGEVDVGGPGAGIEAALVLQEPLDLQCRIAAGLRHAAPDVVAEHAGTPAHAPGRIGLLGECRGGEQGAGHQGKQGQTRHGTTPDGWMVAANDTRLRQEA
jgi:hypothetical protein